MNQVDLEKQMVVEDETLEDISIDELREALCEHEPRFPISLWCISNSVIATKKFFSSFFKNSVCMDMHIVLGSKHVVSKTFPYQVI